MTAKRNNEGKPRLSLIPRAIQVEMAKVLTFGEKKYSLHNWRGGGEKCTAHYLMDSCQRHITAYLAGEDLDEESGLHNLGHAACNIAFLLELLADGKLIDDRYKPKKKASVIQYTGDPPSMKEILKAKEFHKENPGQIYYRDNKMKGEMYLSNEDLKFRLKGALLTSPLPIYKPQVIERKEDGLLRRIYNACFGRS